MTLIETRIFNADGTIRAYERRCDGRLHGEPAFVRYRPNGEPAYTEDWRKGKLTGKVVFNDLATTP
jgi:hypothetical protein